MLREGAGTPPGGEDSELWADVGEAGPGLWSGVKGDRAERVIAGMRAFLCSFEAAQTGRQGRSDTQMR